MKHIRMKPIYEGKMSPKYLEAHRHDELYQELLEQYPECLGPDENDDFTECQQWLTPCRDRMETYVDDVQDELKDMGVDTTTFDILKFFWNENISFNELFINDLAAEYILYRDRHQRDHLSLQKIYEGRISPAFLNAMGSDE